MERTVDSLPAGVRQLTEIAKALPLNSCILLLDEPTSALTAEEVEALLPIVRRLTASGIGIVYVSHKFGEVFPVADQITVLRDGRKISTRPAALTSAEAVVHDMVELAVYTETPGKPGEIAVEARGLGRRGEFADVDLTLRFGEILGLTGLLGARRSELAKTLSGILAPHDGGIKIRSRPVRLTSIRDAMRCGIAYVPEDRKTLLLGVVVGLANGLVVTKIGVNPLVATLGSMSIARGVALVFTEGFSLSNLPPAFALAGRADIAGVPFLLWVTLLLVVGFDLAMRHGSFFRKV